MASVSTGFTRGPNSEEKVTPPTSSAHLSQHLLDVGRKYCFLFTDQANPTNNSIYQKLGYRPISDSERWEFSG